MLSQKDVQEISACIIKYCEKAKSLYGFELKDWKRPTLSFDLKGCAAGQAFLLKNHIKINPVLFKENREAFFKRTIPHEVAHLVAFTVFGDRGHGKDWKNVMTRFGCENSRCHTYDVSSVKRSKTVRRYLYSCNCTKDAQLTKQLHEKLNGRGRCNKCGSHAIFTGRILLTKS